ncbi:PREDICTED: mucin-5AC-like isoform X2 [Tarenaya hassleriana]|uniref:mucin-5AC-like n=1 Tax=Tarenaya hassleriana TaxID=28532 RepID=UPI00053C7D7F|nr:PREDICTED: mucin-5AC-like [Tarenaya hassleriana]XP_010543155.1 PREDICTED: mucin-5AC-like [Tarenaya hassleriana]XP_010543156.1 PREDICTED: mucin-5AC-like isoform X1 [Tarenaya hassleriana]XP_010543157.1 PREDICTED: mucin-5AC-like isoform X2 [Tarenaya hassleriana]
MNRNLRESLTGGRNIQFRRGPSLNGFSKDFSENLDLFSTSRRSFPLPSADDSSDVSVKLGRLSAASITLTKARADDLLCSTGGGKHDYDWLLTPPGTPLGSQSPPKTISSFRSNSAAKASRLSVSHSESNYQSSRPARSSSSVTRPSISTSQYSSYSLSRSPSSLLNTSSASVSSYIRPSSPITRSSSTARPSTPTRTTSSRASTPSRIRPSSSNSCIDKTKPSLVSRPSTPTSRPQLSANSSAIASRPSTRPSTPTRRNPSTSVSASSGPYVSGGRAASNGRMAVSLSRPSSPGPRDRPPQQPIVPSDFPLETPPNLRTTLPDRPISAGRSRPAAATATKASPEPKGPMTKRNPSPVVGRGRLTETPGRSHVSGNGRYLTDASESQKVSNVSATMSRRSVKSSASVTDNGPGRPFSKSSLDMPVRHMDTRNGKGSSSTKSIRAATPRIQSIRSANETDSINSHSRDLTKNGAKEGRLVGKLSERDMYESSRYDALFLKEDMKNMNWLHSIDDKSSDQALGFDSGFELLPEPFAPL